MLWELFLLLGEWVLLLGYLFLLLVELFLLPGVNICYCYGSCSCCWEAEPVAGRICFSCFRELFLVLEELLLLLEDLFLLLGELFLFLWDQSYCCGS